MSRNTRALSTNLFVQSTSSIKNWMTTCLRSCDMNAIGDAANPWSASGQWCKLISYQWLCIENKKTWSVVTNTHWIHLELSLSFSLLICYSKTFASTVLKAYDKVRWQKYVAISLFHNNVYEKRVFNIQNYYKGREKSKLGIGRYTVSLYITDQQLFHIEAFVWLHPLYQYNSG